MTVRAASRSDIPGIGVAAHVAHVSDLEGLEALREEQAQTALGADHAAIGYCLALDREALLARLAVLVAGAIDLTHDGASIQDRRRQDAADILAEAVDLDMARFWTADLDFWLRLPKATLCAAMGEAPSVAALRPKEASAHLAACAKLKKGALAAKANSAWKDHGYLPDLLVTPLSAGALTITPTGSEAIAAE
jgi:hypothetical protein